MNNIRQHNKTNTAITTHVQPRYRVIGSVQRPWPRLREALGDRLLPQWLEWWGGRGQHIRETGGRGEASPHEGVVGGNGDLQHT